MVAYTTTYNLKKPTVADDEDVWGGYLNDSMDLIDDVLDGTTPVTGIDINSGTIGDVTIDGDLSFTDNTKAIFGAGSDLQIYHDGSHSIIQDAGTGDLRLYGNNVKIKNADNTAAYIQGINGAEVNLYYNNALKLATTSTGIDVTGAVTAGSAVIDGHTLQDSTNRSGLLEVSSSLGTWRGFSIASTGTSHWSIMGDQDDFGLYDDVNNEWILLYNENSTLQLYANGSNNFSVTTSGASVTGDLTVTGTVDGVDIAGSIDQALLTTSSPTFAALTITNQLEMSNTLDMNNFDIYGVDQIRHHGDTNTYIQFHAADQFRVVTGGSERLEVNNTRTQIDRLLVTGGLYEDYDALSGTTPTCDADAGGGFSLTMTGNTTFTFGSMTIGSGSTGGFVLELTGNGGTVTWPTSVVWAGGTAPDAPASGETDLYVFYTRDNGTTWYGVQSIDAAA